MFINTFSSCDNHCPYNRYGFLIPETLNVMKSILQKAENSCDALQLQIIMVSKEMFFSLSTTASDDPLMLGSSLHRKLFLLGSKWGTQHHVFMVLWSGGLSRGTMLIQGEMLNKKGQAVCVSKPSSTTGQKRLSRKLRIRLLPRWELPCTRCFIIHPFHDMAWFWGV